MTLNDAPNEIPSGIELARHVARFPKARVLCVGDVMLDRYVYGAVDRISPEAPIPVVAVDHESSMLGGAGNVVRNLVALGARTCFVSVVGDDEAGGRITGLMMAEPQVEAHLLVEPKRRTTIKTRYIAGGQQLLRADQETIAPLGEHVRADLFQRVADALADHDVLLLSDYGKGVLGRDIVGRLIALARDAGRLILVDPKGADYGIYRGATIVTPNRRELSEATGDPASNDEEVARAASHLIEACALQAVVATRSQDGMTVIPREGAPTHLKSVAREVYDVSGAGDTVIATLAAGLGAQVPLVAAAVLANIAAGIVVGKAGTATAAAAEILTALQARDLGPAEAKVLDRAGAVARVAEWRRQGLAVGFTNGCFDLLHPGHISLLSQAAAACDRLVVGLNSDESVARLKGPTRPVQSQTSRGIVLASLADVDAVVVFDEDTPLELIVALAPDVLVKGADYTIDQVVGAKEVIAKGGRVVLADLMAGHSTTATIKKMGA